MKMKKKVSFLIVLCIVSLMAFSGATYAGFSKQYNPQVDDLKFTVATQENMMISTTGDKGSFKDNIAFSDLIEGDAILNPVAGRITENNISLYYDGNVSSPDNYIKFSLYFSGSNDMDIYLAGSTSGTVVDPIELETSIFTPEQVEKMVDSLRIGFLAYSTREIPTGSGIEISYDPIKTNVYSVNPKTDASYVGGLTYNTFTNIGHTEGILDDVVLLSTKANKVSKMDIYIWLESNDVNCSESIFNTILKINLRFFAFNVESGGNNSQ
jgi:hypothetical protein